MLGDDSARVSFSAIGVLLLSAAIVTMALLVKLDAQIARETAREPEISESAELLAATKSDLARLLSWAVQGAAADVAAAPVVAGFQGPLPGGATPEECARSKACVLGFNEERVRRGAHARLAGYLAPFNATYRQGESRATARPAENWTHLTLEPVNMTLARSLRAPFGSPGEGPYAGHWLARLPVEVAVEKPGQRTYREISHIETFVPSRHPLVRDLAEEFARDRLGPWGPVFGWFTGGSFGEVWVKGYLQQVPGRGAGDVYGSRGNDDVERTLNAVLMLDEGLQFQSVDPGSLRSLLPGRVREGLEAAGEAAMGAGEIVEAGARLEELLAGPGTAEARERMRRPKSADEFLLCPRGPGTDVEAGARESCRAAPGGSDACGLCRSDDLRAQIGAIAGQVYSATIETRLTRRPSTETSCPGASGWDYSSHSCSGGSTPPGALGAEVCAVGYRRTCSDKERRYTETKNEVFDVAFVATDHARTSLDLSAAGLPGASGGDLAGAFSPTTFAGRADPNLADALDKYRAQAWTSQAREQLFRWAGSSGSHNSRTVQADVPAWLEGEALREAASLLAPLAGVRTKPGTTPENLTHTGDYLRNVSAELSAGVAAGAAGFAERPRFVQNERYSSAASKALYLARAWFLDDAVRRITALGEKGAGEIDSRVGDLLKSARGEPGAGERAGDALRRAGEFLRGDARFPLGLEMALNSTGFRFGWNETVRLDVDQRPEWLNATGDPGGAGFIPLSVRTWSVESLPVPLAPTLHGGVAILPPPFPWVVTANAWVVNVKGEFELTVEDAGERVWNGTGFEGVGWVRERNPDIRDPVTKEKIGENRRVQFEFWTVIPIVVPPGPMGVGDRLGNPTTCSGEFKC
jgi:hypothetical protein